MSLVFIFYFLFFALPDTSLCRVSSFLSFFVLFPNFTLQLQFAPFLNPATSPDTWYSVTLLVCQMCVCYVFLHHSLIVPYIPDITLKYLTWTGACSAHVHRHKNKGGRPYICWMQKMQAFFSFLEWRVVLWCGVFVSALYTDFIFLSSSFGTAFSVICCRDCRFILWS